MLKKRPINITLVKEETQNVKVRKLTQKITGLQQK